MHNHVIARALSLWGRVGADLPRAFWGLWIGTVINRIGFVVEPFLALYLVRGRGFTIGEAGVFLTWFGVGSFVSQPLGGYLADRIGRKPTVVTGMIATAAGFAVLGTGSSISVIAVGAGFCGLAIDLYRPAVAAMVMDLVPPRRRAMAFGLLYWAINLGVGVAAVIGGLLAEHAFWLLFLLDGGTCLGFAACIVMLVPETHPQRHPDDRSSYRATLADRLLVGLAAVGLVDAFVYLQSLITLPLVMNLHHLGPAAYGIVYLVNPIEILVVQPAILPRTHVAPPYAGIRDVFGGIRAWLRVDRVREIGPCICCDRCGLDAG